MDDGCAISTTQPNPFEEVSIFVGSNIDRVSTEVVADRRWYVPGSRDWAHVVEYVYLCIYNLAEKF